MPLSDACGYLLARMAWHNSGDSRTAGPLPRRGMRQVRIIGIDPGLRRTGWGVIDTDGVKLGFVACGSVSSDAGE